MSRGHGAGDSTSEALRGDTWMDKVLLDVTSTGHNFKRLLLAAFLCETLNLVTQGQCHVSR